MARLRLISTLRPTWHRRQATFSLTRRRSTHTMLAGAQLIELVATNYSVKCAGPAGDSRASERVGHGERTIPFKSGLPVGLCASKSGGALSAIGLGCRVSSTAGFYMWRAGGAATWVLNDGAVVPIDPTINAGTAAVQSFFSILDDRDTWEQDSTAFGLFQTYFFMFGNPFDPRDRPGCPQGPAAAGARSSIRGGGSVGVHRGAALRLGCGLGMGRPGFCAA